MPVIFEMVTNGPYGDGWSDITCVGAAYQEQVKIISGRNEFRHRRVCKHLTSNSGDKTIISHISHFD